MRKAPKTVRRVFVLVIVIVTAIGQGDRQETFNDQSLIGDYDDDNEHEHEHDMGAAALPWKLSMQSPYYISNLWRGTMQIMSLSALMLISTLVWAQQSEELLTPDPVVLKQTVLELCTKGRAEVFRDRPQQHIESREIVRLEREEHFVPPAPAYTSPPRPVYVVEVSENAESYHESLSYVLVLIPEGRALTPLLVYAGGFSQRNLSFELVSINDAFEYPEPSGPPVWVPVKTLLVRDGSAGNGTTQERLLLFRFNPGAKRIAKIFDQVITFTAAGRPYEDFKSTFRFERKGGGGQLDDLVLTTEWFELTPEARENVLTTRDSVFHWNGKEYEGNMNVPKQAKWPQIGYVKPPRVLVDLMKPLAEPPAK